MARSSSEDGWYNGIPNQTIALVEVSISRVEVACYSLRVNADAFPSFWHHGNKNRIALLDCSFRLEGRGEYFECGFQIAASKHGCWALAACIHDKFERPHARLHLWLNEPQTPARP